MSWKELESGSQGLTAVSQDFWGQRGGVGSIASFGDGVSKACLDISAKQCGSWVSLKISMEEMVEKINGVQLWMS